MPNTGKPSLDCHLCRQRRVKCDLAKPACRRCIKYGAVCPGYRDQQELVFRNVNPTTIKSRKKRKVGGGGSTTAGGGGGTSGNASPAAQDGDVEDVADENTDVSALVTCPGFVRGRAAPAADSIGSVILRGHRVTEHWTAQSVPLLLDVYSAMDFLCNVYRTQNRSGPLLWSAHIFTRTYIMNVRYPTQVDDGARAETERELAMYMGKTLRAVNRALGQPGGAGRDDILATVWILANYEVLAGTLGRQQPVNTWQLHAKGLYSMLKARGSGMLYTSEGRTAFWPAFNIVQLQALIVNVACPAETDEWLGICGRHLFEGEELTLRIAEYIARVCEVQHGVMRHLCAVDYRGASDGYPKLRQALLDAEAAFDAYLQTRLPLHDDERRSGVTMDVYMHNIQCAAAIKSNHVMQLLCNLLTHYAPCPTSLEDLLAHRRYALQRIRASAQAIVNNLPAAMEPLSRTTVLKSPQVLFDAMKLVFPLYIVAHMPTTLQEHKDVARQALSFIGREVGIRQALKGGEPTLNLCEEARVPLVKDLLAEPPWVPAPPIDYTVLGF
ncbi:hypothetical protein PWT90_10530 [Aphanocladium album]|nr:hypothetical protein PWT90_10530 [Aphanocladium album]